MARSLTSLVLLVAACSSPAAPRSPVTPPPPPPPPPDAAVVTQVAPVDAPLPAVVADDTPTLRLPRSFIAIGYTAQLTVDPASPTFSGHIEITGEIKERTSVVWLHSHGLEYSSVVAPGTPRLERHGDDLIALRLDAPAEVGPYAIKLDYTGKIDPLETAGMFMQKAGGARYVFTQFEALYARRVFPCIDEPDSKVPWQLTLEVPNGNLAVSNTAVVKETAGATSKLRRFEFAKTKPLPSYLVAFGIGPFDVLDAGKTKSGVPVRIVTLKGRGPDAAYAQQTTAKVIDRLETWFGTPFPYDKLDMLTIPLTVGFGAMENAGLVTHAEDIILFDPKALAWRQRRAYIGVVAHELAHQWFGDLVTMQWWDDLWLNEGFATWLGAKIVGEFDPSWRAEQTTLDTRTSALGADSLVSARRVRQPISNVDDIYTAFDSITYDKGASILSMVESYVGPDVFQRGVRAYVKDKAHSNATSADFVGAISAAAGKDLAPVFSSFLERPGAPELRAKVVCDKDGARIELAQQRHLAPGSPEPAAQAPWQFPVCVAYDQGGKRAQACTLLSTEFGVLPLDGKSCPRWVMPNAEGRGYYRVAFTQAQAQALRDEGWPKLSEAERRTMFGDIADAVRYRQRGTRRTVLAPPAGKLPLQLVLSFVPKFLAMADRFTVDDALRVPLALERLVPDTLRDKYTLYLRTTFGPGATKLGFVGTPTDTLDDEGMRTALSVSVAWSGRDPDLVAKAVELAASWRDLPAATRGSILAIAVDADADVFARVLREIKTETDHTWRTEMFDALGSVRDPKRYEAALDLLFEPAIDVREASAMLFSTSIEATRLVAERVLRTQEAKLLARMPKDSVSGLAGWFATVFAASCDKSLRDEAKKYAVAHFSGYPGGDRMIEQAFEGMDQCIATRELLEPELRGWLSGIKIPRAAKH